MEVDPNGAVYKVLGITNESRDGLMDFLAQPNLTLYDSLAAMVGSFWWWNVHVHAGEERNVKAWNYWQQMPAEVKQEQDLANTDRSVSVRYTMFATQSNGDIVKLDSSLKEVGSIAGSSTAAGISVDVSPDHVFVARDNNDIEKIDKDLTEVKQKAAAGATPNHITYAPDNFLYVSTQGSPGSVQKWDPISMSEVKQNTDVWFEPATIGSSDDNYQYIENSQAYDDDEWDTDGDGTTDGGNSYTVVSQGSWNIPSATIADSLNDLPHNLSFYGMPDFYNSGTSKSLRIDFTLHVRDTDTYEFSLHANDRSTIEFLDGTTFDSVEDNSGSLTDGGEGSSSIEFKQNFNNTTNAHYGSVTLSQGTFSVSVKTKESTSGGTFANLVAVRKQGESEWRNIPVFSGVFGYLNYDADGTLYAQNDYGIFKWDAVNMVCQEAQPVENTNSNQEVEDVVVGPSNLYCLGNGNLYSIDPTTLRSSIYLDWSFNKKPATLHFASDYELILVNKAKLFYFDLNSSSNDVYGVHTGNYRLLKFTITPDKYAYVGYDNKNSLPVVRKYALSDLKSGSLPSDPPQYNLVSSCTGLVYDVTLSYKG